MQHDETSNTGISGTLYLLNPTTSTNFSSDIIAYTPCDEDQYSAGDLSMSDVINHAITANVNAIVFFSLKYPYCNISGSYDNYTNLYTMIDTYSANNIYINLPTSNPTGVRIQYTATLFTETAWKNFIGSSGAPGTAVAMIILYSITGLITLTFLSIIITGAIRAHRHPERYGPRDFLGRPTQSRARGLARAILETLPIVKFGDPTPRADPKDIELGSSSQQPASSTLGAIAPASTLAVPSTHDPKRPSAEVRRTDSEGPAAATSSAAGAAVEVGADDDNALGCSICTDDFERGQDIRVLPCNHKFHPACVDPWLLDVSGTCPLCRIDLRPEGSGSVSAPDRAEATLAPPLENSGRRTAVRRFFAGAVGMDRQQRIEALRRFRQQHGLEVAPLNATQGVAAVPVETAAESQSRANRLRGFLRRA